MPRSYRERNMFQRSKTMLPKQIYIYLNFSLIANEIKIYREIHLFYNF